MTLCTRIFVGLFLFAHCAAAGAQSPDSDWQAGLQAFEENDFLSALAQFESARDAGQSGPAVHYNIGVCQYKLEFYSDAAITFALLREDFPKFVALSDYNLGLIALKLGKRDEARQHFRRSYDQSADEETLRILSSTMLARSAPETPAVASDWYGNIGFRAGYDDNVLLRDDLGLPLGTTTESPMVTS